MADMAAALLDDVKDYLNITWQDGKTDSKITGYINRGMARLQQIAGASLDFTEEGQPRALLLDYCRYANSQALEVFEKNFEAELLDLNLSTQAPIIDNLTILLTAVSDSAVSIQAVPAPDAGNSYVYQVGAGLTIPGRLDVCLPGGTWTPWDGVSDIAAVAGQEILLVEISGDCEAERAGKATV
jgi:hypothetical protein